MKKNNCWTILPKYPFSLNTVYHWRFFKKFSIPIRLINYDNPSLENFSVFPHFRHFCKISKYLYFLFQWQTQECSRNIHENTEMVKRRIFASQRRKMSKTGEKDWEQSFQRYQTSRWLSSQTEDFSLDLQFIIHRPCTHGRWLFPFFLAIGGLKTMDLFLCRSPHLTFS